MCFQAEFQEEKKGSFKSKSTVCHLSNSLFPEKSRRSTQLSTCLIAATDHVCRRHFQISLKEGKRRARIYRGILLHPGACQIIHLSSVAQLIPPLSLSRSLHPNCPHLLSASGQRSGEVFPSVWGLSQTCRPPVLQYFHMRIPGEISQSHKMTASGVAVSYLIPPSRYSTSLLTYGSKYCSVACPCVCVCACIQINTSHARMRYRGKVVSDRSRLTQILLISALLANQS